MQLQFTRTRVHKDKVNPTDADEAELDHWKRVKIEGHAGDGADQTKFEVILDLRPRLLQVLSTDPRRHGADVVGRTLINHMCAFTLDPKEDQFHPLSVQPARAEWIVQDAEHVSGLLHRLREEAPLARLDQAPMPPGLAPLVKKLMQEVKGNRHSMERWQDCAMTRNEPVYGLHFSTASWDALGPRLAHLLHDRDVLVDFAAFFEYSRAYGDAVRRALDAWDEHKPLGTKNPTGSNGTWAFFVYHHETAMQTAARVEKWFAKLESK